jgi:hypothetical protein
MLFLTRGAKNCAANGCRESRPRVRVSRATPRPAWQSPTWRAAGRTGAPTRIPSRPSPARSPTGSTRIVRHVRARAALPRVQQRVAVVVGCQHQACQAGHSGPQFPARCYAAAVGQSHVQDGHVGAQRRNAGQRGRGCAGLADHGDARLGLYGLFRAVPAPRGPGFPAHHHGAASHSGWPGRCRGRQPPVPAPGVGRPVTHFYRSPSAGPGSGLTASTFSRISWIV